MTTQKLKPLHGKRIVVTRGREQAAELSDPLRALGADIIEIPTIKILPPKDPSILREAIEGIGEYDWLIFTSPNAVQFFFDEFFKQYRDIRALGFIRIAAIGPGTKKPLEALHLEVDLMPEEAVAESLVATFDKAMDVANVRFLLPRGDLARDLIARKLEELGAIVDDVETYRNVPVEGDADGSIARLMRDGANMVTFASSSAVENFCQRVNISQLQAKFPCLAFASIGPVTTQTAAKLGLKITVEAPVHSIEGLVGAIEKFYLRII